MKELIDRIKENNEKKSKLIEELELSLALEQLCPDAFADGNSAKAYLKGTHTDLNSMELVVEFGSQKRSFKLCEVPEALRSYHLDLVEKRLTPNNRRVMSIERMNFVNQRKRKGW
jgi:hypothetical protein